MVTVGRTTVTQIITLILISARSIHPQSAFMSKYVQNGKPLT